MSEENINEIRKKLNEYQIKNKKNNLQDENQFENDIEEKKIIDNSSKELGSFLLVYRNKRKDGMIKDNEKDLYPIDSEFIIVKVFDYKTLNEKQLYLEHLAEFLQNYENDPELIEMRSYGKYYIFDSRLLKIKIKKEVIIE